MGQRVLIEGSTPLCLVLVTSLWLLAFISVCAEPLSGLSHTLPLCVSHTQTLHSACVAKPLHVHMGQSVNGCGYIGATPAVLWYPLVRILKAWRLNNKFYNFYSKGGDKSLWTSAIIFSVYNPVLLPNDIIQCNYCDVTAQEIKESTPKNQNTKHNHWWLTETHSILFPRLAITIATTEMLKWTICFNQAGHF